MQIFNVLGDVLAAVVVHSTPPCAVGNHMTTQGPYRRSGGSRTRNLVCERQDIETTPKTQVERRLPELGSSAREAGPSWRRDHADRAICSLVVLPFRTRPISTLGSVS